MIRNAGVQEICGIAIFLRRKGVKKMDYHARTKQPWYKTWSNSKNRCNNKNNYSYKYYGEKGITHDIGFWAVGVLWWRDNAHLMKKPSIDRIDSKGNYTFKNCRFIEHSENTARRNTENVCFGRKHSEETKKKISIGNLGKIVSKETREKMKGRKVWNKGKHLSEEHKQKIRIATYGNKRWLGKKHTEETKEKMSKSAFLRASKNGYKVLGVDVANGKSVTVEGYWFNGKMYIKRIMEESDGIQKRTM